MTLYWAYGSNLNVRQMRARCPDAERVAPLVLPNAALRFRQVADVVHKPGSTCPGGLWRVSDRDVAVLDRYEGIDRHEPRRGLYLKRWLTLQVDGEVERCLLYTMNRSGIMPPTEEYLASIVQGYRDFELDLGTLAEALRHSWDRKNRTPYLDRRAERKGITELARELPVLEEDEG